MGLFDVFKKVVEGKKVEQWDYINPDVEAPKYTFAKGQDGHYYIYYNSGCIGYINYCDLRSFTGRPENENKEHWFLVYKLEMINPNFKNRQLAERVARNLRPFIINNMPKQF